MGLLDELFVSEDAMQAARRRLNADSIGQSVARHMNTVGSPSDPTMLSAVQGGLGNISLGLNSLADGVSDLAESMGRGLGTVNANIESLGSGIDSLHADFNIALGDLIWQLQQQTQALSSIIDTLKAPVGTEAYEYRLRGEDSYKNGWYEEALSDLQKSAELNFRDFSVHRTIGNIFFYHHVPPRFEEAREAYEKAAKYSRPRDAKQAAEAHLFAAFACAGLREWHAVAEHCKESVLLNPALLEAHYTYAQALAQLVDLSGCWKQLAASVKGDSRYFLQAEKDSLLTPLRAQVDSKLAEEKSRVIAVLDDYLRKSEDLSARTRILAASEAERLCSLKDVLSSALSANTYPAVAYAIRLVESQYKPIERELTAMASQKGQLRKEATDALSELQQATYDGPDYVIEVVKPRVEAVLQCAIAAYELCTLDGYKEALRCADAAWATAGRATTERYNKLLKDSAKGKKFECVLQKRADYDSKQEKKRAQDLYDRQQIWRAEGKCLDCGTKVGFVDRLKGHQKCPKHR